LDGVILTRLKQIYNPKGDIFHAMKKSDKGFAGFGEAYFSTVKSGEIKGWKKHEEMTLNLIVIRGEIEFVTYDGDNFFNVKLSKKNYQRLTVKPHLWLAFRGLGDENILLNLASIEHSKNESESTDIGTFNYNWRESKITFNSI
jgi:dTDP-4-dehydrorhamnose 3,5-epimerase